MNAPRGPAWMENLAKHAPEIAQQIGVVEGAITRDGALSQKTKTLMMMLGDALLGHNDGVAALANRARSLGANDKEIAETVAMAYLMGGLPGLVTGGNAFRQ